MKHVHILVLRTDWNLRVIFNMYSKYKSGYFHAKRQKQFNINEDELKALKTLRRKQSIIICKPDKGNGVILLNKTDYESKMETILENKSKFKRISTNNILNQFNKFQNFLTRLKKSGAIDQQTYHRIRPTSTTVPTLYGLPKVHKDNIPLQPILLSVGSFNHECSTWLSEILSPLRQHLHQLRIAFNF